MRPPYRADQVGSLLRPAALVEARTRFKTGAIDAEELLKHEDESIRAAVARQESVGLQSITDGEFRRDYWHIDFLRQLLGVVFFLLVGLLFVGSVVFPLFVFVVGLLFF